MNQSLLPWLCVLGASVCQVAWTYSMKFLQFDSLKALRWHTFYRLHEGFPVLAPLAGYVVFGTANAILLAIAMRSIPTATAFAVWMALTLIFLKSVDVFWLKAGWSWLEVLFLTLTTIGIVGMKVVTPTP